ncbi:MAG: hypothetical protein LWX51_05580 [Deltaproteobacteria bacterium]|jgi:hypothetical protein|nr:hypothetical protein [Deltaproteobacteria bacterium]
MEEEKQIIDAAKALGLGELVPEVYRDMLQPAARQIGDGLATIANAVRISLAPLEAGIWGYGQIKEWLSIRYELPVFSLTGKQKESKHHRYR